MQNVVYQDDKVIVFPSRRPSAQFHLIFLAKTHKLHSLVDVQETAEDEALLGHMMVTVGKVCRENNIQGYRIVMNNGKNAHQTIHNLYFHVLGGQQLKWPPFNQPEQTNPEESKSASPTIQQ